MAKFCTRCGSEVNEEAVVCLKCGCAVPKDKPAGVSESNILTTVSQRININGIIWIVVASLQILIGLSGAFTCIIVGVLNLISVIKDIKYSKAILENPVGIVDGVKPLTSAIITLVYNLVIGGVIGVAGSIYYLLAVRGYVLENEQAFLELEAQYTNN